MTRVARSARHSYTCMKLQSPETTRPAEPERLLGCYGTWPSFTGAWVSHRGGRCKERGTSAFVGSCFPGSLLRRMPNVQTRWALLTSISEECSGGRLPAWACKSPAVLPTLPVRPIRGPVWSWSYLETCMEWTRVWPRATPSID